MLFATFPILFLYAQNAASVPARSTLMPLVVTLCGTVVVWLLLHRVVRDARRAALLVSCLALFILLYGHVANMLPPTVGVEGWRVGRNRLLFPLWCIVLAGLLVGVARWRGDLARLTSSLNLVSALLVMVSLIQAGVMLQRESSYGSGWELDPPIVLPELTAAQQDALPSVYYIILDGHAREDVLQEVYGMVSSELCEGLRARGFYVAQDSRANYSQTLLSLASSLNMVYLDDVCARMRGAGDFRLPLVRLLARNHVTRLLRHNGYRFYAFASGYSGTEIRTADVYVQHRGLGMDEFQHELLNTTMWPQINRAARRVLLSVAGYDLQRVAHRNRVLFILDELPRISAQAGRKFVFAHVLLPHPPFIFRRDGEAAEGVERFSYADGSHCKMSREAYRAGYREQVMFVAKKVLDAVDGILSRSAKPPVIIIQSDHGPGLELHWESAERTNMWERLSILNAYFLPGGDKRLYPNISPVNTFRVILNRYFGANAPLLEDKSFFSKWSAPYEPIDVTRRAERPTPSQAPAGAR
ncbi:hypothetical protein HQ576_18935 [bacterium]|nr:hypothetical protein [bacterium]